MFLREGGEEARILFAHSPFVFVMYLSCICQSMQACNDFSSCLLDVAQKDVKRKICQVQLKFIYESLKKGFNELGNFF